MSYVRRFFHPVDDFTRGAEGDAVADRRQFVYYTIDHAPFQRWVVFVAGIGFITDAYDIFALNVIIPMLDEVYWPKSDNKITSNTPPNIAMFCATLVGTLIGQLLFGVLADLYGRRKMYGLELMVVIMGTLGVAISSRGENNSMNILGWLVAWRLCMGIGIGGDYPLSAVITSEFAPRKHRARMLGWVFYMQPLGQLLGVLVAMVVVKLSEPSIKVIEPNNANVLLGKCYGDYDCIKATDSAWRWVVGLGAVPAGLALTFRLTIPESPRYTMDVLNDDKKSSEDTHGYYNNLGRGPENIAMVERGERTHVLSPKIIQTEYESPNRVQVSPAQNVESPGPQYLDEHTASPPRSSFGNGRVSHEPESPHHLRPSHSRTPSITSQHTWTGDVPAPPSTYHASRELESAMSTRQRISTNPSETHANGQPSYTTGIKDYFITQGNYRVVLGTSLAWGLLDFAFYGLGLNSSKLNQDIWKPDSNATLYATLLDNSTHSLILTSVGAMIGGALMIKLIKGVSPKRMQFWGFGALTVLFIVIGPVYAHESLGSRGAVITLYVLCQMAFYLGPNSTTYMIPAELFPTKWRCTCHGIAAATGKLGSVVAQVFLSQTKIQGKKYDDSHGSWLGYFLLILSAFMAVGAVVTRYLVPEIRDSKGESRSLEVLAGGIQRLEALNGETASEDLEGE